MPIQGQAITVSFTVWNTRNNTPETGDNANLTMRLITDGTAGDIAGSPSEIENGEYKITVAAGENTGVAMSVEGSTTTDNVIVVPVRWLNMDDAGSGARTVTVTVDDGADSLESAYVRFTKGVATYVQSTDASGNATFNLNDGSYTVAISLLGYTYDGSTEVVTGDATPTYSMTAQTITAPGAVTLCTVQFNVKLGNTDVSGAVCKAKLLGVNQASDGTILSNEELSATTDAGGTAELELVRKDAIVKGTGRYKIWVTIDGKPVASVETKIPNQTTAYFEDLL